MSASISRPVPQPHSLRPRWLVRADRAAYAALMARRRPAAVAAARAVSGVAEPRVVYPALAAAGLVAARRAGWPQAVRPGLVVAGGAAARRQLCRVIARPRPPAAQWLTEPEGFSLPSRHTTLAALTAGALVRALGVGGRPGRAAPLLAAAGVGASRVCLGVHWPGDVLAGWAFAEAWLLAADGVAAAAGGGR
ncbi:MAG TPA: phosphatase PAP2 family protein [Streptosporangiaceae bacterium]|nr:phosphatase PAP2 family protein [Streptosporangiaceae bacterium]